MAPPGGGDFCYRIMVPVTDDPHGMMINVESQLSAPGPNAQFHAERRTRIKTDARLIKKGSRWAEEEEEEEEEESITSWTLGLQHALQSVPVVVRERPGCCCCCGLLSAHAPGRGGTPLRRNPRAVGTQPHAAPGPREATEAILHPAAVHSCSALRKAESRLSDARRRREEEEEEEKEEGANVKSVHQQRVQLPLDAAATGAQMSAAAQRPAASTPDLLITCTVAGRLARGERSYRRPRASGLSFWSEEWCAAPGVARRRLSKPLRRISAGEYDRRGNALRCEAAEGGAGREPARDSSRICSTRKDVVLGLHLHHGPVPGRGAAPAVRGIAADGGDRGVGGADVRQQKPHAALQGAQGAPRPHGQEEEGRAAPPPGQHQALVDELLDHVHPPVPLQLLWGNRTPLPLEILRAAAARGRVPVGSSPGGLVLLLFVAGLHGFVDGAEARGRGQRGPGGAPPELLVLLHAVLLLQLQLPLHHLPAVTVLLLQLEEVPPLLLQQLLLVQPQALLLQPRLLLLLLLLPAPHLSQLLLVLLQLPELSSTGVAGNRGLHQRRRRRRGRGGLGEVRRNSGVDGPPVARDQSQVVAVGYGDCGSVVLVLVLVPVVFPRARLQRALFVLFVRLLVSCETVKITWCIH
ncbi:hypothetical protein EYF80_031934 [Liparis tanakae]|uniref:Uncharacterized protein n=1 Tax=Liparis tanakae TaxID=230148 RepID=A0A4Z2GYX0_9TELE|nr:hypothetical protein EYF80_031934 [Liparis tanakae]